MRPLRIGLFFIIVLGGLIALPAFVRSMPATEGSRGAGEQGRNDFLPHLLTFAPQQLYESA